MPFLGMPELDEFILSYPFLSKTAADTDIAVNLDCGEDRPADHNIVAAAICARRAVDNDNIVAAAFGTNSCVHHITVTSRM